MLSSQNMEEAVGQNIHISVVSPVYKAGRIVDELVLEIESAMQAMAVSYEIILVDDRSPDDSWLQMQKISARTSRVKCIRLSRNFGQHPTIMAGLSYAKGDWIVVMDCDLQDQPKEIVKLYSKAIEGFDVVLAQRIVRKDRYFKKLFSKIFYWIYGYFTDVAYDGDVANFGIYNKKVIKSVLSVQDYIKFFPLFVKFVGFNTTSIPVEHASRFDGKSSYSFFKLLSLAFNTIISFSNKPLKIFVKSGLIISGVSFVAGIYYIFRALNHQVEVLGYTSIIVSLWFLSGIIITIIGITGIYIGKIFNQTKNRPIYIIDEMI